MLITFEKEQPKMGITPFTLILEKEIIFIYKNKTY